MLMAIGIFGGMLFQYPVGRIADLIPDRSKVIIGISAVAAITSIMIIIASKQIALLYVLMFLLGGVIFTLYPVSTNLACDKVEPKHIVSLTEGIVLVYSAGAILGPIIAPPVLWALGSDGVFVYFALTSILLILFFIRRHPKPVAPVGHEPALKSQTKTESDSN